MVAEIGDNCILYIVESPHRRLYNVKYAILSPFVYRTKAHMIKSPQE